LRGQLPVKRFFDFYGSLRAVNVLLALLRSTLTVLPPPKNQVAMGFTRRNCCVCQEK
jgi:hypothetical protein